MLHKCRSDSTRRRLAPPTTPNQMIWLETLKVVGTRIINLYAVLQKVLRTMERSNTIFKWLLRLYLLYYYKD